MENINSNNKFIAILSYIWILVLIPYYGFKDNDFISFHAKEGMNLLFIWLIYYVLSNFLNQIKIETTCMYGLITCKVTPWYITTILNIIALFIIILSLIGMINVFNKEKKLLPFINKIRVFK